MVVISVEGVSGEERDAPPPWGLGGHRAEGGH